MFEDTTIEIEKVKNSHKASLDSSIDVNVVTKTKAAIKAKLQGLTKVTKAVFPVAGLGTRFLPATKASPKEMLPVVDKPLIQYAVEEAVAAGIKDLIFIISHGKRSIEDHFDTSYELETNLKDLKKTDLLAEIKNIIPDDVNCIYVRQPEAKGLGHAVLCASALISEDEHFAVILADDLIFDNEKLCLAQMVDKFSEVNSSIVAVQSVPYEETDRYGVVSLEDSYLNSNASSKNIHRVFSIVEKPKPTEAPSNLAVVGRYILSGKIFKFLRAIPPGINGEIQLTDAIACLVESGVFAYKFKGKRFDCGSKIGYMQACVEYALRHKKVGKDFKEYLQAHVKELN